MQDAVGVREGGDGGGGDGGGGGEVGWVGGDGGMDFDEGAEDDALVVGPDGAVVVFARGEVEAVVDGVLGVDHARGAEPGPGFEGPVEVVGFFVITDTIGQVSCDRDEELVFNGAVFRMRLIPP